MKITLSIGQPVPKKNKKNVYVLTVQYMHGDADSYDDERFTYELGSVDEMKKNAWLLFMLAEDFSHGGLDRNGLNRLIKKHAEVINLTDAEIVHFKDDFIRSDVTSESWPASIQGFDIVWFDENGVDYKVDIFFDATE